MAVKFQRQEKTIQITVAFSNAEIWLTDWANIYICCDKNSELHKEKANFHEKSLSFLEHVGILI